MLDSDRQSNAAVTPKTPKLATQAGILTVRSRPFTVDRLAQAAGSDLIHVPVSAVVRHEVTVEPGVSKPRLLKQAFAAALL